MPSFKKAFSALVGDWFKGSSETTVPVAPAVPEPGEVVTEAGPFSYWWDSLPELEPVKSAQLELDESAICQQLEEALSQGVFRMIDVPSNVVKCLEILNQPDFDFGQVDELISHSPVLAANVITMANSSLYNRGYRVTKLGVALPRLGCGKVKAILYFASCERQLSNNPVFSQVATQITTHSHAVAQIADYLSYRYFPDPDKAFLAGLLHDVGKLVLLKEMAASVSVSPAAGAALTESSYGSILPMLHERVGGLVAKHWELAPPIVSVIAHHHDMDVYEEAEATDMDMQLTKLVHLSDTIARMLGYGMPIQPVNLPSFVESLAMEVSWDSETSDYFQEIMPMLKHRNT